MYNYVSCYLHIDWLPFLGEICNHDDYDWGLYNSQSQLWTCDRPAWVRLECRPDSVWAHAPGTQSGMVDIANIQWWESISFSTPSPFFPLEITLSSGLIAIIHCTFKCWIIEGDGRGNMVRIKSSIDFLSKIGHLPSTGDVKLSKSDRDSQIDTRWVITKNGLDITIQTNEGKYLTPSRTGQLELSKQCSDSWQFEKVELDIPSSGVYTIQCPVSGDVIDQPGSDISKDPILYGAYFTCYIQVVLCKKVLG